MLRRENSDKDTIGKNINERKRRVYSEYHPRAFHRPNTQVEEQSIKSGNSCCQVSNTNIVSPLEGSRKSTSETISQSGNEKDIVIELNLVGMGLGALKEVKKFSTMTCSKIFILRRHRLTL